MTFKLFYIEPIQENGQTGKRNKEKIERRDKDTVKKKKKKFPLWYRELTIQCCLCSGSGCC